MRLKSLKVARRLSEHSFARDNGILSAARAVLADFPFEDL